MVDAIIPIGKELARFMGREEFAKYVSGMKLFNSTDWHEKGRYSDSKGFCFFDNSVKPEERMPYLTGVVTMEVCVVFKTTSLTKMRVSYGRYSKPGADEYLFLKNGRNWLESTQMIREYSTEQYSRKNFRMETFGFCMPGSHKIIWRDQIDIRPFLTILGMRAPKI